MIKYLTLLLVVGVVSFTSAQLNPSAEAIKMELPDVYNKIKTFAANDWLGDHEMMVYTINQQSEAVVDIMKIMDTEDFDEGLMIDIINRWKKDNLTDYVMVVYEYRKQIKLKSTY